MADERTPNTPLPLPTKRVYIEIIGGGDDGLTLDSYSANPIERTQVELILDMTRNGQIGGGFTGYSLAHLREMLQKGTGPSAMIKQGLIKPGLMHDYFVTGRIDEEQELLVRVQYEARQVKPREN